jgi:hypothetical protein
MFADQARRPHQRQDHGLAKVKQDLLKIARLPPDEPCRRCARAGDSETPDCPHRSV